VETPACPPSPPDGSTPLPAALPVVETFHSLQGEGLQAGRSAFFIRLAGCTVGCAWCDTKHSWPQGSHPDRSLAELAGEAATAAAAGAAFVVITGGEPLHHGLDPLCQALREATASPDRPDGLPLHLETSGVDPLSGRFDWITLSPKRHRPPTSELLGACQELKVVVEQAEDLDFAEAMARAALAAAARIAAREAATPRSAAGKAPSPQIAAGGTPPHLLLQPAWGNPTGEALALAFVQSHPAWRLSLQSHKLLGVR
jgi:7-carboxy-7-deazaguanine synthase